MNTIRDETADVIQELEGGEIRTIMITGDNVYTGITIAKESGMILPGSSGWMKRTR
jgi:magnesium-transporting ATPase (P-type)